VEVEVLVIVAVVADPLTLWVLVIVAVVADPLTLWVLVTVLVVVWVVAGAVEVTVTVGVVTAVVDVSPDSPAYVNWAEATMTVVVPVGDHDAPTP
jgi:hypothetical protein